MKFVRGIKSGNVFFCLFREKKVVLSLVGLVVWSTNSVRRRRGGGAQADTPQARPSAPGRGSCFPGATADLRLREGKTVPAERLQSCERGVSVQVCRLSQEGRVSGGVSVKDSKLLFH